MGTGGLSASGSLPEDVGTLISPAASESLLVGRLFETRSRQEGTGYSEREERRTKSEERRRGRPAPENAASSVAGEDTEVDRISSERFDPIPHQLDRLA